MALVLGFSAGMTFGLVLGYCCSQSTNTVINVSQPVAPEAIKAHNRQQIPETPTPELVKSSIVMAAPILMKIVSMIRDLKVLGIV